MNLLHRAPGKSSLPPHKHQPKASDNNYIKAIIRQENTLDYPGEDATWLQDDDIVFGVAINGEARAYPRRIMQVREMVDDTLRRA